MAEEINKMKKITNIQLTDINISKPTVTIVVKLQLLLSITMIIATVIAACMVLIAHRNDLLSIWPTLTAIILVVIASVKNIKSPHITTLVIEYITVCLILANAASSNYLLELYKAQTNPVVMMTQRYYEIEAQGDWSVVLDALTMVWLPTLMVGLFYALRTKILLNQQKAQQAMVGG